MTTPSPSESASPPEPRKKTLTVGRLFREHAPRIYRLMRQLLGNDTDAEDATQQVFLQVIRNLSAFRGESALSTWLNRVAVNAALAFRQRRSVRRRRESSEPLEELTETGSHAFPVRPPAGLEAIAHETHELIDKAIARLPELYRNVFVLTDVEDHPNQEVADLLGLSLPAVKSRRHRARLLLRKDLAPYFEETAA